MRRDILAPESDAVLPAEKIAAIGCGEKKLANDD
jgi:hypothetical protein